MNETEACVVMTLNTPLSTPKFLDSSSGIYQNSDMGFISRMFLAVSVGAVIGAPSTFAVTMRDDQPESAYVNLGASSEYASVGSFVNSWGYTGSAVLIATDWILTAAHNFTAASSGSVTLNGVVYTTSQFVKHPAWNGNALAGYDLALAHLDSAVAGVTPATLYAGSDEMGQTATFVGYGFGGTGLTGYQSSTGALKRGFENVIDGDFGNLEILMGCDFDNPHNITDNWFGIATPQPLEGCVANGDSGGGVFLTVNSQTYLAGIISFVASTDGNANADYGDLSGFGRVSAFNNWILRTIPEPSSFSLLAFSLGVLLWRKRSATIAK